MNTHLCPPIVKESANVATLNIVRMRNAIEEHCSTKSIERQSSSSGRQLDREIARFARLQEELGVDT